LEKEGVSVLLWLQANLVNIVILLVLAIIVFFIVRSMVLNKRAGRSSCGGSCAGCAGCGSCHPQTVTEKKR